MVAKDNPIIHSNEANMRHPEPTWLASASVGVIHDVIKHQKVSLKPFNAPAKSGSKKQLLLAQNISTLQQLVAVNHREPTVALSSKYIVVNHLFKGEDEENVK